MGTERRANEAVYQVNDGLGTLYIDEEVFKIIIALTIDDIKGVRLLSGNKSGISKMLPQNETKGISVLIKDETVSVKLSIKVEYEVNIPEITAKVQSKVKNAIENMTGLKVANIDINVPDIVIED